MIKLGIRLSLAASRKQDEIISRAKGRQIIKQDFVKQPFESITFPTFNIL